MKLWNNPDDARVFQGRELLKIGTVGNFGAIIYVDIYIYTLYIDVYSMYIYIW